MRDRRTDRRTSYARHDEIYYVTAVRCSDWLPSLRRMSFLFACGRLRSATTALTLRYVSEFSLAITENNVRRTLRNGALRRAAMRNFHGTFIVNVRSLRCVAYRTVHTQCIRITLYNVFDSMVEFLRNLMLHTGMAEWYCKFEAHITVRQYSFHF